MRELLIEEITPYLAEIKQYAVGNKQVKDKSLHRIRINYGKLYLEGIKTINLLLRDKEMEDLIQDLEDLKNELKEYQKAN